MAQPVAVGLDVGGTKMLCGLVTGDGTVLAQSTRPTPDLPSDIVDGMSEMLLAMRAQAGGDVPVGVGFPAIITLDGEARYGPNVSVTNYPLLQVLEDRLGCRVVLDNDANVATWAEFKVGAGAATAADMIMFTLGTGVGGGIVFGGHLARGAHGFAGELGHLIIRVDGARGPSGVPGELEAYSSGKAIGRLSQEAFEGGRFVGTSLGGPIAPSAEAVATAAASGLEVALDIMTVVGRHLGIAAAGLANCLDPELVVVGGGAAASGEVILQPARAALRAHLLGAQHRPEIPIVPALLGPQAGVVGAALLALDG